jgi:hypothetical protein
MKSLSDWEDMAKYRLEMTSDPFLESDISVGEEVSNSLKIRVQHGKRKASCELVKDGDSY